MEASGPPRQLTPGKAAPQKESGSSKTLADWAQVVIAGATVIALLVTIWVARQGQTTVEHDSQATLRQSEDAQLSTAINSIGSDSAAEEVAGIFLLTQNTSNRFSLMAQSGEPPSDVFGDYTTALQIFAGYLRSHGEAFLTSKNTQSSLSFGLGYGYVEAPGLPIEIVYAADQIKTLLTGNLQKSVTALKVGEHPVIDLSNDELDGQPWAGINFGWVFAYMPGIDLRGANLKSSQWSSKSDIEHSYLQCANLEGANFRNADLDYADLRGANVQGADFRGAHLAGAHLGGPNLESLYGAAKWSPRQRVTTQDASKWNQRACLRDHDLWAKQPSATSSPSAGPSVSTKK